MLGATNKKGSNSLSFWANMGYCGLSRHYIVISTIIVYILPMHYFVWSHLMDFFLYSGILIILVLLSYWMLFLIITLLLRWACLYVATCLWLFIYSSKVIMKFLAFGPLYFHSRRNLFDLFLALAIVLYSIFVIIFFNTKRPSVSVCVWLVNCIMTHLLIVILCCIDY